MGVDAQVPCGPIQVSAPAPYIVPVAPRWSGRCPRASGAIEDVIHAAGQTDVVTSRSRSGRGCCRANLVLLAAGDRLTLVVVLLRLLLAVPVKVDCSETSSRTCQLRVEFSVYSGIIDRRSPVSLFLLCSIGDVVGPVDGLAHRNVQRPSRPSTTAFGTFSTGRDRYLYCFDRPGHSPLQSCCGSRCGTGDARQPAVAFKLEANLFVDTGLGFKSSLPCR